MQEAEVRTSSSLKDFLNNEERKFSLLCVELQSDNEFWNYLRDKSRPKPFLIIKRNASTVAELLSQAGEKFDKYFPLIILALFLLYFYRNYKRKKAEYDQFAQFP